MKLSPSALAAAGELIATSSPATRIEPWSAVSTPARMRTMVRLLAPFAPPNARICPRAMEIETSSSAVSPPNDFEMPVISTMGSAFSPSGAWLLVWRVVPVVSMGVSSERRAWGRRRRAPSPWLLLFRRQHLWMLLDELVDVVRGDEQARDLDHFGLGIDPGLDVFLGLFGDLLATGHHVDSVRGRHVPVLDRLHGGRLTVDRVDLHAASMRLLDSCDSTESWIVPAGPDGQIFAAAWMLR